MSLINEALKKAQRARHQEGAAPAGGSAAAPNGPIAKRGQPRSANSMLAMVIGGVVLVVLSMVFTTWWLTRSPAPKPALEVAAKPAAVVAETPPAPAPVVLMPPPSSPATVASAKPAAPARRPESAAPVSPDPGTPARTAPQPGAAAPVAAPAPAATPAAPESVTPPRPPPEQDERISKFVDAIRVTGIRSSGTDSKVLMNDRVYRVNDIVDRGLGLRLTKVSSDSLTFTDANGATYVKTF